MERAEIHLMLHFLLPLLVSLLYGKKFYKVWFVMILAMSIDIDHLLADPVFDPNRCSLGFHPLHSVVAMAFYALLPVWKKARIFAWGLWIHIGLDFIDCAWM
ncbi:MAG: DUF6122 family protein [Leptospirales bacterium]